jgi:thymidylate synthase (FAD)
MSLTVELIAITPDARSVIELAARTCYQSADRMTEGSGESLLPKLLASGHESAFEHASATFRLAGCSRSMTHQLVRHRLMSVSQRSQRYVTEENFDYVIPPSVPGELVEDFRADMEALRAMYRKWRGRGLKKEDARFVLPNACATEMLISANFREFRHIFAVRCTPHAQWEIRDACLLMLAELNRRAPLVFGDLAQRFL